MVDPRNYLLQLLSRYQPMDEMDEAQAGRIKKFAIDHPDCFERSNKIGHITGSAWLVDPTETKVLLTHHKKLHRWLQLGGHSDGHPNPLHVALREAKEESGLTAIIPCSEEIFDVDVHLIPAYKSDPPHHHFDVRFALKNTTEQELNLSGESYELWWVDISNLEQVTREESILRMKQKWLARPIKKPALSKKNHLQQSGR